MSFSIYPATPPLYTKGAKLRSKSTQWTWEVLMTQRCSQFRKEGAEVCSQTTKPKQNETASISLIPPAYAEGNLCCRDRAHDAHLQQCWLLSVTPFLLSVPSDEEATLNGAVLWIHEGTGILGNFPFFFWSQSDMFWSAVSLNGTWSYNPSVLTHLPLAVSQRGHLLLPCSPCPECRPQSQWNVLPCIVPVRRTRRVVSPLGWQNSLGAVKKERKNQHINLLTLCPKILG